MYSSGDIISALEAAAQQRLELGWTKNRMENTILAISRSLVDGRHPDQTHPASTAS